MNSLFVCHDRKGLEIEAGHEPFHAQFKRMRAQPRTSTPRPLEGNQLDDSGSNEVEKSLNSHQQLSSSQSQGNLSTQLFQRNATGEYEQNQLRLFNRAEYAHFRVGGTSPDANSYIGAQIQRQSSGIRAMTTHDPNNFAFAEQSHHPSSSQLESFVHSHPGDPSFLMNLASSSQSTTMSRSLFSSPDYIIQNPTRATYAFRDHRSHGGIGYLPNMSVQDSLAAHRFGTFTHIDNNNYPLHQMSGNGRGRDFFPTSMSIAAGNAPFVGGGLFPSTSASVHLSHPSSFREDGAPTHRCSLTNFSDFSPDQKDRMLPNDKMRRITTYHRSPPRLQDDDIMTVGTSYESSAVRAELNSHSRSLSAPENLRSRVPTYFTAHSRRNRSENYNSDTSVHHPAARCTSLLSDLDSRYSGSSQRQVYSKGIIQSRGRNRSHSSSSLESNQLLSQTSFTSQNLVSNLRTALHDPASSTNNLNSSDQLASSTLLSLGEQLQSIPFEYGFEPSQSMNSTSANTTTTDTNASSEIFHVECPQKQRQLGVTKQTSILLTSENSRVLASENASPISEHETGESSVDGIDATGHEGNNNRVKNTRKTKASGHEDPVWEEQFESLCQFHEKTGHCIVPARYKENKQLGHWVMTQRRQHTLLIQGKQSALNAERVERLESIGFVWKVRPDATESWSTMFEQMKAYKKKFGDCLVPQRYYPNPQLGTWVHTQRRHFKMHKDGKKSSMTDEKIKNLNSIGFVWSAKVPWKPNVESNDRDESESGENASDYDSNIGTDDGDEDKKTRAI